MVVELVIIADLTATDEAVFVGDIGISPALT
jgi:hypothetical protein